MRQKAEPTIIGAALKEIAGTRQLGNHGHRQDYHWNYVSLQALQQQIDDLTMHGAGD
jgi:hypothetical protein